MVHIIFLFSGVSNLLNCHKGFKQPICQGLQEEVGEVQVCTVLPLIHPHQAAALSRNHCCPHALFRCWRHRPRGVLLPVLCASWGSLNPWGPLYSQQSNPCKLWAVNTSPGSHGRGCRAAATPGRREQGRREIPLPGHTAQLSCPGRSCLCHCTVLTPQSVNLWQQQVPTSTWCQQQTPVLLTGGVWSLQQLSAPKICPFLSKLGILQPWKLLSSTWNHIQTPQGLEWQKLTISAYDWPTQDLLEELEQH